MQRFLPSAAMCAATCLIFCAAFAAACMPIQVHAEEAEAKDIRGP